MFAMPAPIIPAGVANAETPPDNFFHRSCTVHDHRAALLRALPKRGEVFDCRVDAPEGIRPLSAGFGIAKPNGERALAYWEADTAKGRFIRQPIKALGWDSRMRCTQPEAGE